VNAPVYLRWSEVDPDLRSESSWRREGYRVRSVHPRAYFKGRYTTYPLYSKLDVEKTKPRNQRPPVCLAFNPENLGKALWEINKAAKRRRASAREHYMTSQHKPAGKAKHKKSAFYEFKDNALRRLLAEGVAKIEGYHSVTSTRRRSVSKYSQDQDDQLMGNWDECAPFDEQNDLDATEEDRETRRILLEVIAVGGFRFHRPVARLPQGAQILEELQEGFSGPASITFMRLSDAVETLSAYLRHPS